LTLVRSLLAAEIPLKTMKLHPLITLLLTLSTYPLLIVPITARPCSTMRTLLQQQQQLTGAVWDVQTVDVNIVQQECLLRANAYFNVLSNDMVTEVAPPSVLIVDDTSDCCSACHSTPNCNVWQWCPDEAGCNFSSDITEDPNGFPYHGCQLLSIPPFSPQTNNKTEDFRITSFDVPLTAGTSLNVSLPRVPGYSVDVGADLLGRYNIDCEDLTKVSGVCFIAGSPEEIAVICDDKTDCLGFTYYNYGIPSINVDEFGGFLKGGFDPDQFSKDNFGLNPSAAIYLKDSSNGISSADDSNSTGVIIGSVVGSVIGVALLIAVISAAIYIKHYKRLVASLPVSSNVGDMEAPKDLKHGGGEMVTAGGAAGSLVALSSAHLTEDITVTTTTLSASLSASASASSSSAYPSDCSTPEGDGEEMGKHSSRSAVGITTATAITATTASILGVRPKVAPSSSDAKELLDIFATMYSRQGTDRETELSQLAAGLMNDNDDNNNNNNNVIVVADLSPVNSVSRGGGGTEVTTEMVATRRSVPTTDAGGSRQQHNDNKDSNNSNNPSSSSSSGQLNQDQWTIDLNYIEICRRPDGSYWQLGSGAFGTVFKGLHVASSPPLPVAVKVLHALGDERRRQDFIREATLLKTLKDDNIVRFLGAYLEGPAAMMVTEFMEFGDLWRALPVTMLSSSEERIFGWYKKGKQVALDVARGLAALHRKRIVHLDLKSANILLAKNGQAKVADIGMARVLNQSCLSKLSNQGTFAWSAPEVLNGKKCSERVDIYSFGVVVWEICSGEVPVRGDMRALEAPRDCPDEIVELQRRCVSEDPRDRPTADEIVQVLQGAQ